MKILIQHRSHRRYLKEDGQWTVSSATARCFDSSIAALDQCLQGGLGDVQILLRFPAAGDDVILSAPNR